jgi:hypothetical protein
LGCRFFFQQTRTEIDVKFPNLSGGTGDPKAGIAAKGTIDGYGWLNSIYNIAKDGIFTKPEYSPIESVLQSGLYEIFTYLSWKNACGQFDKRYSDLNSK